MEEIIFETYEEVSDKDISGTRQDEKQNFDNDNNSDVTSKSEIALNDKNKSENQKSQNINNIYLSKNFPIAIFEILKNSTINVIGDVNIPGKYPLGSPTKKEKVIKVAGGFKYKSYNNNKNFTFQNSKKLIFSGDTLFVQDSSVKDKSISIVGSYKHINNKNKTFTAASKLSEIFFNKSQFSKDAYLNFAVIKRIVDGQTTNEFISFSP